MTSSFFSPSFFFFLLRTSCRHEISELRSVGAGGRHCCRHGRQRLSRLGILPESLFFSFLLLVSAIELLIFLLFSLSLSLQIPNGNQHLMSDSLSLDLLIF